MRVRCTLWTGLIAAAAMVFLSAAPAGAAGFSIFEQGAKGMGMAGAFTAQADDPSMLFHNAGGLAFVDERAFAAGATLIISTTADFRGGTPFPGTAARGEQEKLFETPPHVYYVQPLGGDWNFGFGVNTPFGLTTEWKNKETFPGRWLSTKAALRTFDLNPTLGWKASPKFGLGFGVIARFSDVELERFIPQTHPITHLPTDVARVSLESDLDSGYGWNFGILHKYNESFSWGFSYRSRVTIDYGGDARFTQIPTGIPPFDGAIARVFPFGVNVPVKAEIQFPDEASLGFAMALGPRSLLELDINWTGWSSFDEVPITFVGYPLLSSTLEEQWKDVYNYRLGVKFGSGADSEWRFGVVYDKTPQPDKHVSPLLPDADRLGWTAGYGRKFSATSLDVAVMYLPFDERTTTTSANNFNGTYNTTAWLFGVTLGF